MSNSCETCVVKKELIELTTILSKFFDITERYTWAEQGDYQMKITKILKRLKPQENDAIPE
jgi:hypothetical protein